MNTSCLLVTGFEPFDGQTVNPSWEAVRSLPDRLGSRRIVKAQLPVEYGHAAQRVLELAAHCQPGAIVCIGQAGGRDAITPEVVGINLREAAIADNAGTMCQGNPIDPHGPDGCFATLPVRQMVQAMKAAGIPARLSYSAGAYVCNDVLYTLATHFRGTDVAVGFIHVPWLPEQGSPSLPLETITRGLVAALESIL